MGNSSKSRQVLVIAYDFPPRRTSGVYRPTNLSRHLLPLGWCPTVLTVESGKYEAADSTLLKGLPPEICVERTKDLNISGWEETAAEGIRATGGLKSSAQDARQPLCDRWVRATGDLIRSVLYFPDEVVGWVPGAFMRAVELHLQRRFDVVYTTSPPRSAPLVGLFLKILFGVPWVAEFRDPWYPHRYALRRRLEQRLLNLMVKRADLAVVISKGHARHLVENFAVPESKIVVISNGFEEGDFTSQNGNRCDFLPPGFLHFSHFGTVYGGFSGKFFQALQELLREQPDLKQRMRVNVIGFPDEATREASTQSGLKEVINIHSFVPHDVAIDAMRQSDVLLVFLGREDTARLSGLGKIYDYLRVGKPVLAVAYEGGTAELVREGGAGWVVDPQNTQSIKETLRAIVQNISLEAKRKVPSAEFVSQFRYDRLAGKLAEVFEAVSRHD
jgi:glycosyltransferase involved in cell wall biosynthesis